MNDGSYSNATLSIWHMKLYDKAHVLKEFHAGMGENISKRISGKLIVRVSNALQIYTFFNCVHFPLQSRCTVYFFYHIQSNVEITLKKL